MIKVLIVEDDPMVVKFNKYYLEQVGGFELKGVAASADDAFSVLEKEPIDLILLDIYMPGINGLELLSQLRKTDTNVDVIIVSAAKDSISIKKALQHGAVDYLIKPFEFERFSAALSSYKNREKFINSKEHISQEELDKLLHYKQQPSSLEAFPKGLDKNTLKLVWDKILEIKDTAFSTDELAVLLGISRVSIRKYLNFLEEINALKKEVIYGSLGRPIYKYKYIKSNTNSINNYL
ncbi:response regulator [Clostridium estertheticum]|uniref:response regulator n=1 Tax=Clostridium estertheticum TaxID=238834 RepID=UPI0013E95990|nr:response regulator [Clostridium estertheticum]MBZ9685441.1 response regulator [Clostridium estertheticum]